MRNNNIFFTKEHEWIKVDGDIQLIPPPISSEEKTLIELELIETIGQKIKKED